MTLHERAVSHLSSLSTDAPVQAFAGFTNRLTTVVFDNAFVVQGNKCADLPHLYHSSTSSLLKRHHCHPAGGIACALHNSRGMC